MVELLQQALDFGLSWVATIALAWYVYHQNKTHNEYIKTVNKEHKDELREITKEHRDRIEQLTEKYTSEVEKLRESVDNNTIAFRALYDALTNKD